jgi:hypothetical protein
MYKLPRLLPDGTKQQFVFRLLDDACIPFAADNTDYIAYLAWVAEGNTPLPAEENT